LPAGTSKISDACNRTTAGRGDHISGTLERFASLVCRRPSLVTDGEHSALPCGGAFTIGQAIVTSSRPEFTSTKSLNTTPYRGLIRKEPPYLALPTRCQCGQGAPPGVLGSCTLWARWVRKVGEAASIDP
jgi:hypothetical protein